MKRNTIDKNKETIKTGHHVQVYSLCLSRKSKENI